MRSINLGNLFVALLLFAATSCGCSQDDSASTPGDPTNAASNGASSAPLDGDGEGAATEHPGDDQPPEVKPEPRKPEIVEVKLTVREAETCLVRQGHEFPLDFELPNLEGDKQKLLDLQGEKLTAVLFFASGNPYSMKWLEELAVNFEGEYPGLKIVAVNTEDPPAEAKAAVDEKGVKFPVLLDRQKDLFHKVATEGLPRLFLLNADGKILWFAIDYSNLTYNEFRDAVLAASDK